MRASAGRVDIMLRGAAAPVEAEADKQSNQPTTANNNKNHTHYNYLAKFVNL